MKSSIILAPEICDYVYATATLDCRGQLVSVFFARCQYFGTPLVLIDWDVMLMCGQAWAGVGRQLSALAETHRARSGALGVFVEGESLWHHATEYGLDAYLVPPEICSKVVWPQISMAATVRIRAGDVTANDQVAAKQEEYKNRHTFTALEFAGGDRPDDETVAATVFGVVLGLDPSVARYVAELRS